MITKKTKLCFGLVLCLFLAVQVLADKVAVIADGRLARIEYAAPIGPEPPSNGEPSSQSIYGEATFDFFVQQLSSDYRGVGFLNVVAELNPWSFPGDGLEWVCQNIPVSISDDLTEPAQSVWFNPHQFDQTGGNHYPGEHDVWPGQMYEVWAMISDTEVNDIPGPTALEQWDYTNLPGGFSIWGLHDTMEGVGQVEHNAPPSTEVAKTTGKIASPLRTDMPDIAQKDMECGPTSTTNSLRWLAKKHDFSDKLPKKDDDLIKNLMKAMTGSDHRPFGGLDGDQLHDGKIKYAKDKELPMIVKGGLNDPKASGAKAFDYIKSEFDAGEDIEFLIAWPGGGSHWVTVAGYGVNGNRLFLKVKDPDDGKKETVTWELDRNGHFKTPRGDMLWAVSESYVKQDDIAVPADNSGAGHHNFSAHTEQQDDGSRTFVQDTSSDVENQYNSTTHKIHLKNDQNNNEVKIIKMTARFFVPLDNDRNHPRFNPRQPGKWADVESTSQIVQRNKHYSYAGGAGQLLEIEQKWKLVPNPSSEEIDLSRFFVGTHPLELLSIDVDTWCMKAKVNVEETNKESKVSLDGALSDAIDVKLTQPPQSGATVQIDAMTPADGPLVLLGPGPLVFDESNWDIPQRLEFGAVSEPNDTTFSCQTELLQLSLTSTDPAFQDNYLPPIQVLILNRADDPPCPPPCPDPNGCGCTDQQ